MQWLDKETKKNAALTEAQEQNVAQTEELSDDMLEQITGGLVQLINPSSRRL